ncbi:aromatic acid/H+ symport family MFS transporter [Neisseriaceae bacterium TC5R-5]|nr:aromatic acid/H+ symport family MFS transporter [Neisseriaceae bacterium TC5R-5]
MTNKNALDIQHLIDHSRFSPFQYLTFVLCFLVVLLDGFDTAAIGYIAPSLMQQWGVAKPDLAPVLSAALFGLAAGALSAGPLADRFGRKPVLLGAVSLFALFSLASAYAASLNQLVALRFVTGVGLGAAMPNVVTLMSEFSPQRRRLLLTNAMFCGFPLGAACGGFLASWMIPHWGWRSVLLLGGLVPLLLLVLLWRYLPESVRFLVAQGRPQEQIRRTLARISPLALSANTFVMSETTTIQTPSGLSGLRLVLSRSYLLGSLMLWLSYFMGLVIFYALISWMPLLFREAGLDSRSALLISALFPLGGVGAIACGWLMDRFDADFTIAACYLLTAIGIYAIGQVSAELGWLVVTVFVAGTLMNTAQSSLPALAASFYPTSGRATGVAWMLGIGRFGGIAGSFLVAELARQQLGFSEIFTVLALPALLASAALLLKRQQRKWPDQQAIVTATTAHD